MPASWVAREDWAAANLASFSSGLEKLKTVGNQLQEHTQKLKDVGNQLQEHGIAKVLTPMIEDAFELKEKTNAQRELERWSSEQATPQASASARNAAAAAAPTQTKPRRFSGVQGGSGAGGAHAESTPPSLASQDSSHPAARAPQQQVVSGSSVTPQEQGRGRAVDMGAQEAREAVQETVTEDENAAGRRAAEVMAEASMADKVIHEQRRQLEQCRRDKLAAEQEREALRAQVAALQKTGANGERASAACISSPLAHNNSSSSASPGRSQLWDLMLEGAGGGGRGGGGGGGGGLGSFKSLSPLSKRRALALMLLLFLTLALVLRMLTRVDQESMPDTDWDLEIDHSEMQRLVAALTADKARVALRGSVRGNSNSTLDQDLDTVKSILKDLHKKNMKSHGHAAPQLLKDNQRLEKELEQLRAEIASLRGPSTSSKSLAKVSGSRGLGHVEKFGEKMGEKESRDIGPHQAGRSSSSKRAAVEGVGAQVKKVGEKMGEEGRGDVAPKVDAHSAAGAGGGAGGGAADAGGEVEKVGQKVG